MAALDPMLIGGPLLIFTADVAIYLLIGKLGKRSSGKGTKYMPFTGGEEEIPPRGTYQSDLFVFAAVFMVAETFALLLAGSFSSPTNFYPLLFLPGGGGAILIATWWLIIVGKVRV